MVAKSFRLLPVILFFFLTASCVDSTNPISDPDESLPDLRLYGTWISEQGEGATIIERAADAFSGRKDLPVGIMLMKSGVADKKEAAAPQDSTPFFVTSFDSFGIINGFENDALDVSKNKTWNKRNIGSYVLLKYRVLNDRLQIWSGSPDGIAASIEKHMLKGEIERDKEKRVRTAKLTDTTATLCRFLQNGGDKILFPESSKTVYQRLLNVVKGTNGKLAPGPGYDWANPAQPISQVKWAPGKPSTKYPNVVAGKGEQKWAPAPGYKWMSTEKGKWDVKWVPQSEHSYFSNVIASNQEAAWQPAAGYAWATTIKGNLRVAPIPSKEIRRSIKPISGSTPIMRPPILDYSPDDLQRMYSLGMQMGYDMDTVYAIAAMSRDQVDQLRRIAIFQGHDWDNIYLKQRLPIARRILFAGRFDWVDSQHAGADPRRRGSVSYRMSNKEALVSAVWKILGATVADSYAHGIANRRNNLTLLDRVLYAGARTGRDLLIKGALHDLFPDGDERGIRTIHRVVVLYLDGKLTGNEFANRTFQEEVVAALAHENPEVAQAAYVFTVTNK